MNFCFLKKHRRGYWNIFSLLRTVVDMVLHNSELSLLIGPGNTGKFNCRKKGTNLFFYCDVQEISCS